MLLHEKICSLIEDRENVNLTSVANQIGVTVQYMSNFKSKGTIGFCQLLKLSRLITIEGKSSIQTMSEWCLELDSAEAIKHSFEYAALTRNVTLLKQLIEKHSKERGTILEYVKVYSVLYRYITDEIAGTEIIYELKKIGRTKDRVLEILIKILKCYEYYHRKKFDLMLETVKVIESKVRKIDGERKLFIKECYTYRIAELFAPIYLKRNNTKLTRNYAQILINTYASHKTVSDALYILGMTYLFENKVKCLELLQRSYELSKKVNDKTIQEESRYNLDLVKLYLGIELPEDSDYRLVFYQKNPHAKLSVEYIQDIIKERKVEGGVKEFFHYFLVVASNSHRELHILFEEFLSQTNYLFSSIVAEELYKKGDYVSLARSMVNLVSGNYKGDVEFEKNSITNLCMCNDRGIIW
ncbi:AimR family lysis-lysogeny pheromone receptor [Bacillus thuringiensis]